jgi:hypothetical protein
MATPRVDLTLLKRLVRELEASIFQAEKLHTEKSGDPNDYTVEIFRAMGLISGVIAEGTLLIGDLRAAFSQAGLPNVNNEDLISKLFGGKGPGNAN